MKAKERDYIDWRFKVLSNVNKGVKHERKVKRIIRKVPKATR